MEKLSWQGIVTSVQPRIRLMRSYDERSHSYLGFALVLEGVIDDEVRMFSVEVGIGAHEMNECSG